ncbi:hypothetical protein VTJ04DRAFT_1253 [Mycothermus thermophilus]|uniref:uncharacterized protein n=1 Tax=Humicola insolens TaxID=85995 RepID=UPI003743CDE8
MPRAVDQDVHSCFVEFKGQGNEKCMLVQCIYCQQVRAKNTTRQKQHLLQCSQYLAHHPEVALQQASAAAAATTLNPQGQQPPTAQPQVLPAAPTATSDSTQPQQPTQHVPHPGAGPVGPVPGYTPTDGVAAAAAAAAAATEHTNLTFMPNPRINGSPMAHPRPSLGPGEGTPAKKQKTRPSLGSNLPEIPLREVHAAFEEFRAKEDDKCLSARCKYCQQVRAKNTSRQREHLMICPGYQSVLKEKIPANSLRHQFDDDDVASSLALPTPSLDLDFRMSIKVKPKLSVGATASGKQSWISCTGGQWAGSWGKGILLPSGQDMQTATKDTATRIDARYLMQTSDEHPALIICKMTGWLTGEREVMERLQDPVAADTVAANRYRLRVTMELETGDERYQDLNNGIWVGSGCRRGGEIVYDAYRVN